MWVVLLEPPPLPPCDVVCSIGVKSPYQSRFGVTLVVPYTIGIGLPFELD